MYTIYKMFTLRKTYNTDMHMDTHAQIRTRIHTDTDAPAQIHRRAHPQTQMLMCTETDAHAHRNRCAHT